MYIYLLPAYCTPDLLSPQNATHLQEIWYHIHRAFIIQKVNEKAANGETTRVEAPTANVANVS